MAPETGPRGNQNVGLLKLQLKPSEESILIICGVLIALIFLVDISLVIGFVVSILYVVPVLICMWSPKRRTIFLVAGAASVLTLVAVPLKPPGDILLPLLNRPLSLVALWTVTFLVDRFTQVRKRAEEALRESEQRFRTMADGSPNLIWVSDANGRLLFSNRASKSFFGRDLEGIGDRGWLDYLHPDDAKEYYDKFLHALQMHEPFVAEARNRRADGAWRWLEAYVEPRFSDDGTFLRFIGTSVDITERKETEQALRESEGRMRLAQEVARIGTFEWNIQTGKNMWTPELEAMYGIAPGAFPGTQPAWEELVYPEDRTHAVDSVNEALKNGTFEDEWRVVWPNGSIHWLYGRGYVFKDDAGTPIKLLGVNIDITSRKRAMEELRRSNDELQQFAYAASHDLQEPLRMISAYLGLLNKKYGNELNPQAKEYLSVANNGAERMRQLINDLLQYSRLDSRPPLLEEVDMNSVVRKVEDDLKYAIHEANGTIDVKPMPILMTDGPRIVQVMQNLISNSIKFRGPLPPKVEVSAHRAGREWVIAIKDNGIGIDPRHQGNLFKMFHRLHTSEEYPGTGIGLAISKKIVEQLGGRMWLVSKVGEGSTFFFSIPDRS